LPDIEEWNDLINFLSGDNIAGLNMVNSNLDDRKSSNSETKQNFFAALPGGSRYEYGEFQMIDQHGFWWTSTEGKSNDWRNFMSPTTEESLVITINFSNNLLLKNYYKKFLGMSIRCVMD
jgi:uncharacterized protein (TIGR02145 family)